MDWDCCLFCGDTKREELRGRIKVSSKEKEEKEKEKIEESYLKIASLIHQLATLELFSVERFSCDNTEKVILAKFKEKNAVYHHNCVSNNQQKLKRSLEKRKRDEVKQKQFTENKRYKRSDHEEKPMIALGDYKCLFCGKVDDVGNLCAGGTQHATSKKINEEKNRAFSDNLWQQASKLQDSHILSFLSLGSAAAREMNYHRACLTDFHNRYRKLVTSKGTANEQSYDSYKTELHFRKIIMHVLDKRRLGVNVFGVTELEKIYTGLLLDDFIQYTPHVTRFAQRLKDELEPLFYYNKGVELRTIGRTVSLCFSEDIDEIISNEFHNPATFVTGILGVVSPIRQAMSKVSNSFTNSFPSDCQKTSVPIQLQILCSLLVDGCDPQIKGFSQSSKTIAQLVMHQYRKMTGHSSSVISLRRHLKERETPVPIYVGLKLYASLRTKTVIQRLFSLGLSISYERCLSICNNISFDMLKKYDMDGVFVANHLTLETFTVIAKDNIDLNARATKVKKHFHGISMTTMQFPSKENPGVKQNVVYDMSLLDNSDKLALPEEYEIINEPPFSKTCPLSLPVCTINIDYMKYKDALFKNEFDKEITWLKLFDTKSLPWSSYHSNYPICSNFDCFPGRHSLMPLINEKVNTLKSQYHCMNIIKKTIGFINKGQVPIETSDQPVYAISKEIQIRYPLKFGTQEYICALGDLHMEHTGLLVHGELIKGSGLDTLFFHSKLSTEGTSALVDVNDIKRSRYCLQVSVVVIYTLLKKAYTQSGSTLSVLEWLDEAARHSQMCFYWKIILNFEILMLIYMRSIREGNFELYLASLYRILPWFFAFDRYNYARWGTLFWFDMELLKHRCPNEYQEFAAGNFSFLKTNKRFSRMALDQVHEQNNKYIKSVSGATSLINRQDDSALVRWELCGPELCRIIEEFEEVESSTSYETQKHHEDSPTFKKDFIKDTTKLLSNFPNNPFVLNELTVVNNVDMVFDDNVFHNLTQLQSTGENQLYSFIEDRLIKSKQPISAKISLNHFQLPGFKKSTKKHGSAIDKRLSPVFITKLRSAIKYRREHAKLLFSSEIYGYCQSLSEDGSDLYHGVKSNILNRFEQVTDKIETSSSAAILIELSPMFRIGNHSGTFGEFARRLFDNIKKMSCGYSRVDIICDRYFNNSLKNLTRNGRGQGPIMLFNDKTSLPRNFNESFLKNNDNKERLNLYCADKFHSYQNDGQYFTITRGGTVLSDSVSTDESISNNSAEEADQKLVRHMIQCVRSGMKQCIIRTVDTDVIISLIAYRRLAENFNCLVFACLSSAASKRFYDINKISADLGEMKCRALPFFYALTGCDIVSSFFNHGKCKFWDRWAESQEREALTTVFIELSEKPTVITEDQISLVERFIGLVYYGRCINSIDSERMQDFEYSLHGNLRLIPPSRSGLKEHVRRAAYYAGWVNYQCVENVCLPSPLDWGWRMADGLFMPSWHSCDVSINADSLTVTCNCTSRKCIKCKCATLSCIPFCNCQRICIKKSI